MTELLVTSSSGTYPVVVGHGVMCQVGERLKGLGFGARVAVVTDENVARFWREPLVAFLTAAGLEPTVFTLPPGEANKSLRSAELLYGELIRAGFSRAEPLLALGGGVVGDLAGFVAATFHRGMPLVQLPTSLLAQTDSSIGGKVGVDHPLGKNLVGAFHPPRFVLADVATLNTLPVRERWTGIAEMVKHGLIADAALLSALEHKLESFGAGHLGPEETEKLVADSVAVKTRYCTQDEKEQGVRMHLNFGHTLGHALETATGYGPLTHGEAIVFGMRAAVRLSAKLGELDRGSTERALALLARFPRPPGELTKPSRQQILENTTRDKKALAGKLRFIVLSGIGRAGIVNGIAPELLEEAVDTMLAEM